MATESAIGVSGSNTVGLRSRCSLNEKDNLFRLIENEVCDDRPEDGIRVRLFPDMHKVKDKRLVVCEASTVVGVDQGTLTILQNLGLGVYPEGVEKAAAPDGRKASVTMYDMPPRFSEWWFAVDSKLTAATRRYVGLLRWRLGIPDVYPFWAGADAFTLDGGATWHELPHSNRACYARIRGDECYKEETAERLVACVTEFPACKRVARCADFKKKLPM